MEETKSKYRTYKHNKIEYLSRGEVEIAKFLDSLDIDFEYEFPIAVVEYGKAKLWYPDFYLKEYQVVVEYFGRYNFDETYKGAADHKKEVFKKCGIQFVALYHINNNWEEYLLNTISTHQETKVKKITDVLDNFNKDSGGFIKRLKNFLVSSKSEPKKSTSKAKIKTKISKQTQKPKKNNKSNQVKKVNKKTIPKKIQTKVKPKTPSKPKKPQTKQTETKKTTPKQQPAPKKAKPNQRIPYTKKQSKVN